MAQTGQSALKVTLPSDKEIAMTRTFDAPRELVFKAHSSCEHMKNWWGPRQYEVAECEVDFRPGGQWRIVHRAPDGGQHTFYGEYKEIVEPEKITWTFGWEGFVSEETMTLTEQDGKTTISTRSRYDSKEARDAMMQGDSMEQGASETYDRLEEYLRTSAMTTAARDVDEYLAGVPEDARATLEDLRRAIREAAPEAEEVISYQIPTYKLDGHLVAMAAWKNHCGFYVMSNAVLEAHGEELKRYAKEKSTLHFAIGEPIPSRLVQTLVKERIAENKAAAAERANKRKKAVTQ